MLIRSIHVRNFRSLRNLPVGGLSPFVVLYGDNDTGKSNLLAFLEILFQEKYAEEVTVVPAEGQVSRRSPTPFWRGTIDGFSDNFFRNNDEPISYSLVVRIPRDELMSVTNFSSDFVNAVPAKSTWLHLALEGEIQKVQPDQASITLFRAKLGSKSFFDATLPSTEQFLPGYKSVNPVESKEVFDRLMARLTNSFLRIPANRFISEEREAGRADPIQLSASSIKNWLFKALTDRANEELFQTISSQFNAPPFEKGRLSVARVSDDLLDILVQDQTGLKLPIGRKGSGIQQIMLIIAYVLSSQASFVGIEELEINLAPPTQAAVFNELFRLVQSADAPIKQLFLTTHSPHLAYRNEATRRAVWLENGETRMAKPSMSEVRGFFRVPGR